MRGSSAALIGISHCVAPAAEFPKNWGFLRPVHQEPRGCLIEGLGEAVRADVLKKTGVQLDWEIRRLGRSG